VNSGSGDNPAEKTPSARAPFPSTRRERVGWYFYDWAMSAFSTTVAVVFLGPYLTAVARAAAGDGGFVYPFGIELRPGSFYPFIVSFSVVFQALCLPLLGAIADYSHRKKQLFALFAYGGAIATMGMYFVFGTNYLLGGVLFVAANLSYGASVVFYNAFLPDIAAPEQRDSVSSIGWAIGYLGGGLLLALNLLLFLYAGSLGLTEEQAVRISLFSAGAWWALFALLPLAFLKPRATAVHLPAGENYLSAGFKQLRNTLKKALKLRHTLLFLVAYLFYNDGIQTVIAMSSQFGAEELKLPISTLVNLVLVIQFVAFFGALAFNYIAKAIGTKRALVTSIIIWSAVVVYAYAFLESKTQFFVLGAVIGIVLGGSQALSRSLFSLLIPRGEEAEYFSLYEVSQHGSSWLGPLLFGLSVQLGSYRVAILSLVVFFVIGLVLLFAVDVRKGAIKAGNEPPPGV
jgi:UMF1 family MFS transporter